jgi:hypothetical protein
MFGIGNNTPALCLLLRKSGNLISVTSFKEQRQLGLVMHPSTWKV